MSTLFQVNIRFSRMNQKYFIAKVRALSGSSSASLDSHRPHSD